MLKLPANSYIKGCKCLRLPANNGMGHILLLDFLFSRDFVESTESIAIQGKLDYFKRWNLNILQKQCSHHTLERKLYWTHTTSVTLCFFFFLFKGNSPVSFIIVNFCCLCFSLTLSLQKINQSDKQDTKLNVIGYCTYCIGLGLYWYEHPIKGISQLSSI